MIICQKHGPCLRSQSPWPRCAIFGFLAVFCGFCPDIQGPLTIARVARITARRPASMRRAIRPAFIRPASMRRENF